MGTLVIPSVSSFMECFLVGAIPKSFILVSDLELPQ